MPSVRCARAEARLWPAAMASSHPRSLRRSAARLAAVQALYQREMEEVPLAALLAEFHEHRLGATIEGASYARASVAVFDDIVAGVDARCGELDALIAGLLVPGWSLDRLDKLMKAMLRAAAYELAHRPDLPTGSVIGDYVEVARAFYDKREVGFVHGLLDALAKEVRT